MPLPFPVRIAAGLVATAVEQARDLPRLVIEFPITAVSQALQASMRVQQKVTELAIKGDRALGTLRPAEEKPSWATFDEDEPPSHNGAGTVTTLRPPGRSAAYPDERPVAEPPMTVAAPPVVEEPAVERAVLESPMVGPAADEPSLTATLVAPSVTETFVTDAPISETSALEVSLTDASIPEALPDPTGEPESDPLPPALPDYAGMSIPQLRGKLRFLSLDDLRGLLEWETTHGDRPPFVTMLSNRITTVVEG